MISEGGRNIMSFDTKNFNATENEAAAEKMLEKFDKESTFRKLAGKWNIFISLLCVAFSVFQTYTAAFGVFPAQIQRSIHLAFALSLGFLLYPVTSKKSRSKMDPIDVILALISAAACLYITVYYHDIMMQGGMATIHDVVLGSVLVLLVLEATRRVVGAPMTVVAVLFLIYAKVGPYIPGFMGHRGFSVERIISHMYISTEGIFGLPLGVSATFVFMFVLFGAFLQKSGLGKFFIDLSLILAGNRVGGPAKVSVFGSCLFGTISGSSVANTVTTCVFTIPLMKKIGYPAAFAGGVEAAASTGGQIMPPIMGAAAFIMAQFLGIAYVKIAVAATLPAILYYTGVWVMVHMEGKRLGLKGIPREDLPDLKQTLAEGAHLFLPIVIIVYLLLKGYTPMTSALISIISTVAVAMLRKNTRFTRKTLFDALETGARSMIGVAIACGCAGIIIGVVTLSGMGLKIANGIIYLAHGMLLPTLLLTMCASMILGMGLPTTAKYIILATMAAPAIQQFGVPDIAAHLFILYFGIMADITPPVALAAFAASGIAGSHPMKTGVNAVKIALAGFIVPYAFVYNPELLFIGDPPKLLVCRFVITAILGTFSLACAASGYWKRDLKLVERVMLFASSFCLIDPKGFTDAAGLGLLIAVYLSQKFFSNDRARIDIEKEGA